MDEAEDAFLLDRLDGVAAGGEDDIDDDDARHGLVVDAQAPQPQPAARGVVALLSRPALLVFVGCFAMLATLVLVALHLDALSAEPWAVALAPTIGSCVLAVLFLCWRLAYRSKGRTLSDHLDSKRHILFWLCGALVALWSVCALALRLEFGGLPFLAVLIPLSAWCVACAAMLVLLVAVRQRDQPALRLLAVAGAAALLLVAASLALVAARLDGFVAASWGTLLAPFFVLCCLPVLAPVAGCVGIRWMAPQPSCGHIWNCRRADPAEAVVFLTAALLMCAVLFPPMITVVLLLPVLDEGDVGRLYSVALLPTLVQLLGAIVFAGAKLCRGRAALPQPQLESAVDPDLV